MATLQVQKTVVAQGTAAYKNVLWSMFESLTT